jgi:O-antigen/teichoic acid export membrane protein
MSNAIGRVAVAAVAVLALGGLAAGMMTGVLLGMAAAVVIAVWQTRWLWLARAQPFDWRPLLRQVVPLMLGCGAVQFLFTADPMFVKFYFSRDEEVGFYDSAGTLARALMWLVVPLATVMFPRLVHSTARGEKNDVMGLALVGTAILSVLGAIGLWVVGPMVVGIVNGPRFVPVASALLPWYAAAMVPLAVANVLVNALFARSCFRIVPPLCVLALAYAFALTRFHDTFVMVLKTLGVFNLLLLALCAWFNWADQASRAGPQNS